ncbi:hypothetical protein [Microcoleus sp. herbarium14]|uniref:hypothetical protein n=1 Tax=Microcoleus sp. herbarium14 TaxID=3055439 RepID=UPI002FD4D550
MKSFILRINNETDLGIIPLTDGKGYTWVYNCIESGEIFPDAKTALFDWIKWVCTKLDAQTINNWDELGD